MRALYLILPILGILAIAYHLANGIWSFFSMGWGLTVSKSAIGWLERVSILVFVCLLVIGLTATLIGTIDTSRQSHDSVLQRIEAAGTNVTFTTLARLCEGFGVEAAALLKAAPKPRKRRPGRPAGVKARATRTR